MSNAHSLNCLIIWILFHIITYPNNSGLAPDWNETIENIGSSTGVNIIDSKFFKKYKIEFLPVELQGFKKKKITMGNDIETSEPLWFALFFHCLK